MLLFWIVLVLQSSQTRQINSPFKLFVQEEKLSLYSSLLQENALSISHPDSLLKPFLIPRVSGSQGIQKVAKHIQDFFRRLNWNVELDAFEHATPFGKKPFVNIIATQNPRAPRKLVLACHYDSKYFADFEFIGATDSAAPCAILLSVAQNLNSHYKNDSQYHLDGMDSKKRLGEEAFVKWTDHDSLYGSRHLAAKWAKELVPMIESQEIPEGMVASNLMDQMKNPLYTTVLSTIDVFILLDLLGSKDNIQMYNYYHDSFISNLAYERLADIEKRLALANLSSESWRPRIYENQGHFYRGSHFFETQKIQDDHIPFHAQGVPIVHCIPYPFPHFWHEKGDDASALDENALKDLSVIFTIFVAEYLGIKL